MSEVWATAGSVKVDRAVMTSPALPQYGPVDNKHKLTKTKFTFTRIYFRITDKRIVKAHSR